MGDRDRERSARIASGICFDWQKGRCTRGSSCKFTHDGDRDDNRRGRSRSRSRSRSRDRRGRSRSRSRSRERIPISKIKSRALNDQLRQERVALVKRLTQGDEEDSIDDNTKEPDKIENNEENEEDEIQKLMGFSGFDSTKGKIVYDNHEKANIGAVSKHKKREYRQYMNRKGGFNRLLDAMD